MDQNLSYLVCMPKYGHIVFCSYLSQLLSNFDKTYLHVFRRLVATSRAPHGFGHVDVIWQNCVNN